MERRKFTREFKLDAVRLGTARLFFIIFQSELAQGRLKLTNLARDHNLVGVYCW